MAEPVTGEAALQARVQRIAAELRCLVCQNQSLADSNAPLAEDLRRQVREMLARGASDREVVDYMTARYGDFVRYRPPLKPSTGLLWFGPGLLLGGGLAGLLITLRRRSRLAPQAFEPDPPEDGDEEPAR
jgi:cytochrome c-type biogenesis protein CcmH